MGLSTQTAAQEQQVVASSANEDAASIRDLRAVFERQPSGEPHRICSCPQIRTSCSQIKITQGDLLLLLSKPNWACVPNLKPLGNFNLVKSEEPASNIVYTSENKTSALIICPGKWAVILFYGGPLSNFKATSMEIPVADADESFRVPLPEGLFQLVKLLLHKHSLMGLLSADTAAKVKACPLDIPRDKFNKEAWDSVSFDVMQDVVLRKTAESTALRKELMVLRALAKTSDVPIAQIFAAECAGVRPFCPHAYCITTHTHTRVPRADPNE